MADFPNSIKSFPTLVDLADSVLALHQNERGGEITAIENYLLRAAPLPGGRLTLESGVAVSTTDQLAKTTLYYTPRWYNQIYLHSGSGWNRIEFSEASLSLASIAANTNYDVFGYNNAGSLALELTAWTNGTTRAVALATQDGRYVKSGDVTRLYLGTIRGSAAGNCEDSLTKRFVWNYYNRVYRRLSRADATSHTYTSSTVRYWNNDASMKIEFVVGLADTHTILSNITEITGATGATTSQGSVGFGINTDTALNSNIAFIDSATRLRLSAIGFIQPQLGYNFYSMLERGLTGVTYHVFSGGVSILC